MLPLILWVEYSDFFVTNYSKSKHYQVLHARSVKEALLLYGQYSDRLDLLYLHTECFSSILNGYAVFFHGRKLEYTAFKSTSIFSRDALPSFRNKVRIMIG